MITEPWVRDGAIQGLKLHGNLFYVKKKGSNPRSCILASRDLNLWTVCGLSDSDTTTCNIRVKNKDYFITSAYLDKLMNIEESKMLSVIEHCDKHKKPLLIATDSNSHSKTWGNTYNDARGATVESIVDTYALRIYNVGAVPTFVAAVGETVIDLTISNTHFDLSIDAWKVDQTDSMSDHRYLSFEIDIEPAGRVWRRNIHTTNWQKFIETLTQNKKYESLINKLKDTETKYRDLDSIWKEFEIAVRSAFEKVCPKKPSSNKRPVPGWNGQLEELRKKVRATWRREKNSDNYKQIRREYQRLVNKHKREAWREFCTKSEEVGQIAKVIRNLRDGAAPEVGLIKDQDGVYATEPGQAIRTLLQTHFPGSLDKPGVPGASYRRNAPQDERETINEIVTQEKLKVAMRSFKPYKAPGKDGIHPITMQNLPDEWMNCLREIYIFSLTRSYIPKAWRDMEVIFIPKQGKDDYDTAKAFRPITLSSFFLKCLEKLIQWHMEPKLRNKLVAQHGFQSGRSTETAISTLVDRIEGAIYRKQSTLAVFLDIAGAFDNISFSSIYAALRRQKVEVCITNWYMYLLRNRVITTEIKNNKGRCYPINGVPQGDCLAPLMWSIVIDDLLSKLQSGSCNGIGFADDIALTISGPVESAMAELMQAQLDIVEEWCNKNKLRVNATKTVPVMFTQKKKPVLVKLRMGGETLEYQDEVKYLGVILQKNLNWNRQLEYALVKAKASFMTLRALVGKKWGLSPSRSLWVYKAMVRPAISYGCMMWATKLTPSDQLKLEKMQRLACVCSVPCLRSTPTRGLEAILDLVPLDLFLLEEAMKARVRTRNAVVCAWGGMGEGKRDGHIREIEQHLQQCERDLVPTTQTSRRVTSYRIDSVPEELPEEEKDVYEGIFVYSDGSKLDNGDAGTGCAITKGNEVIYEEKMFLGTASVYQAEMMGLLMGIVWLTNNVDSIKGNKIVILCDNKAAIYSLAAIKCDQAETIDCKNAIERLETLLNDKIRIRWVKGHANNSGNELADALAKEGARMVCSGCYPQVPISKTESNNLIREYVKDTWLKRWNKEKACRQTRLFIPVPNNKIARYLLDCTRFQAGKLVQWLTGHAKLNRHLGLMGLANNSQCRFCEEEEETTIHLVRCPRLHSLAEDAFNREDIYKQDVWIRRLHWFISQPQLDGILKLVDTDNSAAVVST